MATVGLSACGSEDEGPTPRGDERIVGKDWHALTHGVGGVVKRFKC